MTEPFETSGTRRRLLGAATLGAALLPGCSTGFVTIAPDVSTTARKLGHAEGDSYAHLLFGSATYNVVPIRWCSRVDRAYDAALASVPGATALGGVTVHEDWFWWVVGSARHLQIEGEAVAK